MESLTITRVAHATVLIQFGRVAVLTDPWFSEKFTYHPGEPRGIAIDALPELSAVVASHGHYDHFDVNAFRAYRDLAVPFVVKRGIAGKARGAGFSDVSELDPWETREVGPLRITAAPARHGVPEITFVLECGGFTVYFGGDTLLIPELEEIPRRFPSIDVALLSINGLKIRPLFNRQVVMNVEEAAQACAFLAPRFAVPIHYAFTGGPVGDTLLLKHAGTPEQFMAQTALRAPATRVRILAPGARLVVEREDRPGVSSERDARGSR